VPLIFYTRFWDMYRKRGFNIHNKINMKVTSFEISKKLAKIGFKAESKFYWVIPTIHMFGEEKQTFEAELGYGENNKNGLRAYDLETILDALPMGIDRDDKRYDLVIEQRVFFSYSDDDGNELEEFSIMQKGEESLADTAASLLIQLHNAGLVKFKEE